MSLKEVRKRRDQARELTGRRHRPQRRQANGEADCSEGCPGYLQLREVMQELREVMQAWVDYLERLKASAEVVENHAGEAGITDQPSA